MECSNKLSLTENDFEARFSEMRIRRSENPARQSFHEMMKNYFKHNQELCDWIINLWTYAQFMFDDMCKTYAYCNFELIKEYWDHENYISCEFLIDHLMKNDPSFFNFDIFCRSQDLMINKVMIYDIIKLPTKKIQPIKQS